MCTTTATSFLDTNELLLQRHRTEARVEEEQAYVRIYSEESVT